LQIAKSFVLPLFEHIISNMKTHNHLHIVLQINFVIVLIIPNWTFALMLHHPRLGSFHNCFVLQFDLFLMAKSFRDYHLHHLMIHSCLLPKENNHGDCQN
jgi:hypothetical protein